MGTGDRAMLLRLHIEDLAIIDALTLDFTDGFTALTGETGAGKSIILGALNLVMGERASSDDVRTGCESAVAEALFDVSACARLRDLLAEWGLLEGDVVLPTGVFGKKRPGTPNGPVDLVLRREIGAQGRSRCLANGRMVTLAQLRQIGDRLVDLHGQHQHQSLLRVETHREILDGFGDGEHVRALGEYRALFERYSAVVARLRSLNRDEREIERQKGVLEYQLREISEAELTPGEDAVLDEERRRLTHAEALKHNATEANDLLYEGENCPAAVADLVAQVAALAAESVRLDPSLGAVAERLEAVRAEVDDLAATLRSYAEDLEHDPERLSEIEDRLHLIRQLKRKYGGTIEEILEKAGQFERELHTLTHGREEQERLEAERAQLEREVAQAAERLSAKRRETGERFSKGLQRQLKDLEMTAVRFEVRLDREESGGKPLVSEDGDEAGDSRHEPSKAGDCLLFPDGKRYRVHDYGVDLVEFLFSPNVGEALKPLRKIASGGELSRIMLGLKVLLRSQDQVPTLIFDEIDTGISGRTGTAVGEKMADLGGRYQVVCITHLPQIAARAAHHFVVRKTQQKGRTLTRVERLDTVERQAEIARLLGGEPDSAIARRHASELLAAGKRSA